MNQSEYERMRTFIEEKLPLWDFDTSVLELLDQAYTAITLVPETDYRAFDDGDTGPTTEYSESEITDGIFNLVIHLTKTYAQVMTPVESRVRVAAWLDDVSSGLKKFSE